MATIQFSHANGFPASTYSYMFDQMDGVEISYVDKMGHGDFPVGNNLNNLADELIWDITQKQSKPVVGVGHSVGGVVTILAALKCPEIFDKLIFIDPALLSNRKRFYIWFMRKLGLGDQIRPIRKTLARKSEFASIEEPRQILRNRPLFENFHPKCYDAYIENGFIFKQDGVELAFSPLIEAEIYRNLPVQLSSEKYKLKGTLIYGKNSNVLQRPEVNWRKQKFPNIDIIEFEGSHLFPFEHPKKTAEALKNIITRSES